MHTETAKAILNLIPIVGFFAAYTYSNLTLATAALIVLSGLALIIEIALFQQKPSTFQLISFAALLVFGSSTLLSDDPTYIKLKPTFLYSILGAAFLYSMCTKKYFSSKLIVKLSGHKYKRIPSLDLWFAISFFMCAASNEIVWRNYSEEFWVKFKVFLLPFIVATLIGISIFYGIKSCKPVNETDSTKS